MIVECEKCKSQFNLDEGALKFEGSKVRCSICKNIFLAFPEKSPKAKTNSDLSSHLEETITLDSPPDFSALKSADQRVEKDDLPFIAMDRLTREEEGAKEQSIDEIILEDDLDDVKPGMYEMMGQAEPPLIPPIPEKRDRMPIMILLVVFLVLIGGIGAIYMYLPQWIPAALSLNKPKTPATAQAPQIKLRIQAQTITSYFIKSDKSGEIFVIKGNITNNYPTRRKKILLQVSIFDDKNKVILTKPVYAGNILNDEELKEMTIEQLDAALNNPEDKPQNTVESGAVIPFMAVFHSLPDNAKDFSPDLISSLPGA